MAGRTRVAVVQLGARLGDTESNLAHLRDALRRAVSRDASLVVFPECYLTGYMFDSRAAVEAAALDVSGREISAVAGLCAQLDVHIVVGFLEDAGDRIFNTAALIGPDGLVGCHRKRHLPYLGADRFVDEPAGLDPPVFTLPFARVGLAVCYEIRFPEVARTLALSGADVIALPTCWPLQSRILAEHFTRVRAAENFVYLLVANRNDHEEQTTYLGLSQIVDPAGHLVAAADEDHEDIMVADIDVEQARDKSIIFREGEFEVWPWRDRRPLTYRI